MKGNRENLHENQNGTEDEGGGAGAAHPPTPPPYQTARRHPIRPATTGTVRTAMRHRRVRYCIEKWLSGSSGSMGTAAVFCGVEMPAPLPADEVAFSPLVAETLEAGVIFFKLALVPSSTREWPP